MTGTKPQVVSSILNRLALPVPAYSLAAFRILFGSLLLVSILRFFAHGWIDQLYIQPKLFFTFFGFSWIHPWPAWGMYLHFALLGLFTLGIIFGYYYRTCSTLFFLGFTYVEFLDVTNYLNHYYLVGIISFLMIFLPAQQVWAIHAKPGINQIPQLALWILRAQLSLVYFYAGLGKIQPDWLLQAQPLRIWLSARSDLPFIGSWLQETWVAYAMSWSGAFYDLTIPLWLLWGRTRPKAFVLVIVFHCATALLFPTIGMFPWFMIALSTIFFPPMWPVDLLRKYVPFIRNFSPKANPTEPYQFPRWTGLALALFFTWQILWPLRHFAYPGNPLWTEEAFRFSWNVMLMEKAGQVEFSIRRGDAEEREIVDITPWLTPLQKRMMSTQPDLILQMAQWIAEREKIRSGETVAVYADAMVSLNGRPPLPLINPETDLVVQKDSFLPKSWIMPLH